MGITGHLAPEMFIKKGYTGEKIDIFSAGVSLFMLITSNAPFRVAKAGD